MPETVSSDLKRTIRDKLIKGELLWHVWEDGGRLHIERPLPFLVVYRYPHDGPDEVVERIASNEAAHLVVPENNPDVQGVVVLLTELLSKKFGAFMLLEIWSDDSIEEISMPQFDIYGPMDKLPATVEGLENGLKKMPLYARKPKVNIHTSKKRSKRGIKLLLSEEEWKKMECLYLGLSVNKFYHNPDTDESYPLLVRSFLSNISDVLKKTFFHFVKIQTTHKVGNYHVFGRTHLNDAVWEVDKKLIVISDQIDFLKLITPLNSDDEWRKFRESNYKDAPHFTYRLLPVDPDKLKRQLYNIPIEKVEDPTMNFLFREKRFEVAKMLTMLGDRESKDFLYNSMLLFGEVEQPLLKVAEGILSTVEPSKNKEGNWVTAKDFARAAKEELAYLKKRWPELEANVEINDSIVGLMVSKGMLYIGKNVTIAESRVEALIQHEVGTHILTYFNGKAQPLKLLYSGVSGYEELQEGLAVLSEYLVGGLNAERLRKLAARVVAVKSMIRGESFNNTFKLLVEQYAFAPYTAFNIAMRVFRGGGLTKDAVYLRGLVKLLDYLKEGKPLEPLFIGKITEEYLSIMQELQYRNILNPIPLMPRYLEYASAQEKIKKLQKGVTVFNLIE